MDDQTKKLIDEANQKAAYKKESENRLEARWYIDSVVGDEVLIDIYTNKIIARRPQRSGE